MGKWNLLGYKDTCACLFSSFAVTLAASLVSFLFTSRKCKVSSLFVSLSLALALPYWSLLAFLVSLIVSSLLCVFCQISERLFLASHFLVIMSWDALSVLSSGPVSETVQWSMLQMLSLAVVVVELDKLDDRLPLCRRRRCCKTNVL